MNGLMSDIQSGFVKRRLPDGGFKQQYSPMVMRKFRKSVDNGEAEEQQKQLEAAVNSPRMGKSRKGLQGSMSEDLQTLGSPSVRRRRSRIPSEEDDQLLNYLVTGAGGPVEKNNSVGNLGKSF